MKTADTRRSHLAANIMLVGALIAGAYFLGSFLAIAGLAVLTVIVFNPIYRGLVEDLRGRTKLAVSLTVLTAVIVVVVPLMLVALLSYFQALTFFANARQAGLDNPNHLSQIVHQSIDTINHITAQLPDSKSLQLSPESALSSLRSMVPTVGNAALGFIKDSLGGLVHFITGLVLYLILLVYLFLHQDRLVAWIKRVSPFAPPLNDKYLAHMSAVGRSMVYGTFVIGIVQGLIGAISFTIAGIPYPVFWAVILTVLAFIPLGSGLLVVPIGLLELLLGNIWQGLFILAVFLIITTNIDNLLRAVLVSKQAQLPAILTLFSAFAGLQFFGVLGVIYGPILMAVIMTTIQIYNEFGEGGIPLKNGHS